MNNNNIRVRQICFIFLALMPINKIFLLPSQLAEYSHELFWITEGISFLIDIFVLFLIIKIGENHHKKTFYGIISDSCSEGFARFIYLLYGIFFMLKSLVPLIEQKYFIDNTLYEVTPNFVTFYPLFLISFYAALKGLKNFGRLADICIWTTAIALSLVLYFSIGTADFSNLLPIIHLPELSVFKGSFDTAIWFGGSIYLLFFLGHFEPTPHYKRKLIISFSVASVTIIIFTAIFYAIFGPIAKSQFFAAANMPIYSIAIIDSGRFDYLALFFVLFSGVITISLPIFAAAKTFERAFNFKSGFYSALAVNVILLIAIILFDDKLFVVLDFCKKYINWYFVTMSTLVPVLFTVFLKRKKSYAKI